MGGGEHCTASDDLVFLDSTREGRFAITRQQRHGSHRTKIDSDRVLTRLDWLSRALLLVEHRLGLACEEASTFAREACLLVDAGQPGVAECF